MFRARRGTPQRGLARERQTSEKRFQALPCRVLTVGTPSCGEKEWAWLTQRVADARSIRRGELDKIMKTKHGREIEKSAYNYRPQTTGGTMHLHQTRKKKRKGRAEKVKNNTARGDKGAICRSKAERKSYQWDDVMHAKSDP